MTVGSSVCGVACTCDHARAGPIKRIRILSVLLSAGMLSDVVASKPPLAWLAPCPCSVRANRRGAGKFVAFSCLIACLDC
jgi:hypothetical protein